MAEKDYNYNITTTFYAKWILPVILIIIGSILIFLFVPAMKFVKGKDYDTKTELVFYRVNINGEIRYVEIKDKLIYEEKDRGSNTYYYNTNTEYDKKIPSYSSFRANLSTMGSAGGIGLTIVGLLMLVVNTFNAVTKVSKKKKDAIYASVSDNSDNEDEEDDE